MVSEKVAKTKSLVTHLSLSMSHGTIMNCPCPSLRLLETRHMRLCIHKLTVLRLLHDLCFHIILEKKLSRLVICKKYQCLGVMP